MHTRPVASAIPIKSRPRRGFVGNWDLRVPPSRKGALEIVSEGGAIFFRKIDNFLCLAGIAQREFKIPAGQHDHRRRYQDRRPTPQRGSLKGPLCSDDLVMTEVSVEMLISRIGRDSLAAGLNHREQTRR